MPIFQVFRSCIKQFEIKYKLFIFLYVILSFVLAIVNLNVFKIESSISSLIIQELNQSKVISLIISMSILGFIFIIIDSIRYYLIERTQLNLQKNIRINLVSSFTNLHKVVISKIGIGGLTSLVINETVSTARALTGRILEILLGIISSAVYFIFLFKININVTIIYPELFITKSNFCRNC